MNNRSVAYFSMEIAVHSAMPTYSGGLGILAGDTVRSAADLRVPMLAITLLHRKGYLTQSFDPGGWQREAPTEWRVEDFLAELPERASVQIEGRSVHVRAWRYEVKGISDFVVPVYFLDTDLPENSPWDRTLTHYLYGGDAHYRLCQEVVLGVAGVRMVRALGHHSVRRFHLNEGHASFLTLELLDEAAHAAGRPFLTAEDIEAVKERCIFTTHTPVPSGHDQFPMDLVGQVLGKQHGFLNVRDVFCTEVVDRILQREPGAVLPEDIFTQEYKLNLTYLALNLCHYVNGVAQRHAEVSRRMYPKYQIDAITNGVHAATWTVPAFQALFDRHIPGWQTDNFSLRYAHNLPGDEVWAAHLSAKRLLFDRIRAQKNVQLDPDVLTLGFARRMTPYKRADLLLADVGRLKSIAAKAGRLQLIYGGKAHSNDEGGKEMIRHILRAASSLQPEITLVFLENYDMSIAKLLVAGVDVWLNTPLPPLEASGTSGMKAALNGVPSFSILDGWWLEGCIESVTGWAIGERTLDAQRPDETQTATAAAMLYDKLEHVIAPLYYGDRDGFVRMMRHTIALNGSFFNTQRMVQQYVVKAYFE
ncbi:MAG: alpha-glucan family phosphorylase [Opitutus sp.]